MKLVEIEALGRESTQRALAGSSQLLGPAIRLPAAAGAGEAPLRCNYDLIPVATPAPKGSRDQTLVMAEVPVIKAVDVGSIDEGNPGIERRVDDPYTLVFGRAVLDREVHPAVSNGGNPRSAWPEAPAGDHG
jgi:hypothetical protein